jgi:hypothetical protein
MNEHLEKIMTHYKEALDELMGAQKYAKCAHKSTDADDRAMYQSMAKQELEHEERLVKSAERIVAMSADPTLAMIWKHLKNHLDDWHNSIHTKLGVM